MLCTIYKILSPVIRFQLIIGFYEIIHTFETYTENTCMSNMKCVKCDMVPTQTLY
jgi:hypothetical protein